MTSNHRLTPSGWALILASVAALTLGGCGRKGPLDLPPTAASAQTPVAPGGDTEAERAAQPGVFNPTYGSDAPPAAAKGRQRSFILDPLLGN
ncbi:LPS translocon maturation chaperone LptM [Bradyrhizobium cenepequi]